MDMAEEILDSERIDRRNLQHAPTLLGPRIFQHIDLGRGAFFNHLACAHDGWISVGPCAARVGISARIAVDPDH